MLTIGLTGPTGAGKTTALRVLEDMGFTAVDCDALYYDLLRTDRALRRQLEAAFGPVFRPDGTLDRGRLGGVVFADPAALRRLNSIVYPAVNAAVEKILAVCAGRGAVVDAINLVECGLGARCDLTVAITAPREARLRRIMARDHLDEAYARRRIDAQKGDGYYKKHCTFLLENRAGSQAEFTSLIREFFTDLINEMEEQDDGTQRVEREAALRPEERL